jgi:signal peptidase I
MPDEETPDSPDKAPPEETETKPQSADGSTEPEEKKLKRGDQPITFWQGFREVVIILVIAALVAILVQSFFFRAFIIPSSSMEPTLMVGDRVMVDKVTFYFRKPHRGDVVVWRYPPDSPKALNTTNPFYWPFQQIGETLHLTHRGTEPFVKRVIATEGETLQLKQGQLYINGKKINEPYIVKDNSDFGPVKVPKGTFYGLGDNRPNSRDSRFFGPIPYRAVIGRVFLIWWPFSHFGKPKG